MTTFELALEQVRRRKRRRRLARVHLVAQPLHAEKPKAAQPTHEPVKIATEVERRCWEADFLSRQFISPSARALHREIIKRYLSALP